MTYEIFSIAIKCYNVTTAMHALTWFVNELSCLWESRRVLWYFSPKHWTSIDSIKNIIGTQIKEMESQPVDFELEFKS